MYSAVAPELLTEDGHLIAALLAAGDGALLSHGTAAWRWRIIPAPPSVMQLAVPRAAHGARRACRSSQAAGCATDDVTLNGRFPSTTVARTLLDLATRYTRARSCVPSPRPSSSTTCAPQTSTARSAAGTPAARTCAPRSRATRPATDR